ncbi:hypothetical protein TYRP_006231 [Tyrophagus putrescentiae]|nr:hypothetical protein TYRP_006231 [Tyrophagus putrescentiae]
MLIVDVEHRLNGPDTFQLALNFYLSKKIIYNTYDELMENLPKEPNTLVTELMHYLYGIESTMKALESTSTQPAMLNVDQFYSRVWEKQVESTVFDDVVLPQNAELIPTLRTFQKSAVKWMIYREKQASEPKKYAQNVFVDLPILLGGMEKLYYNRNFGYVITEQVYTEYSQSLKPSPGGILADEMGLGKTVETLALTVHNKKEPTPQNFSFFNRTGLFALTEDPLWGYLQCSCGAKSIRLEEQKSLDQVIESSLQKKYHLLNGNENEIGKFIKCLLCGNYQHTDCSGYQPDQDDFPYSCGQCWAKVEPIDSACTLIVCPRLILQQWKEEIGKHLKDAKVVVYNGIKKSGKPVLPAKLASQGIVLTTYDVLCSELNFSQSSEVKQLCSSPRYFLATRSPLLDVHWWRLRRWRAPTRRPPEWPTASAPPTGGPSPARPIRRSVDELFGLLAFIQEKPFCRRLLWDVELYDDFSSGRPEPLVDAIGSGCFWRTPKSAISEEELAIARPIYIEKRLELSAIERDYYHAQARDFAQKLEDSFQGEPLGTVLGEVRRPATHLVALYIDTLRQSCCQPAWSMDDLLLPRGRGTKFHNAPWVASLSDVLGNLTYGAKTAVEKTHSTAISHLSELAARQAWLGDTAACVATYRRALRSIEKYKAEEVDTDTVQQYHVCYNLALILQTACGGEHSGHNDQQQQPLPGAFNGMEPLPVAALQLPPSSSQQDQPGRKGPPKIINPTESDVQLMRSRAQELLDLHISSNHDDCYKTDKARLKLVARCDAIRASFQTFKGQWFIAALAALEPHVKLDEFVEIRNLNVHPETADGLLLALQTKLSTAIESINKARNGMVNSFAPLIEQVLSTQGKMEDFRRCHFGKTSTPSQCGFCKANEALKKYEELLFSFQVERKVIDQKRGRRQDDTTTNDNNNDETDNDYDTTTTTDNATNSSTARPYDVFKWDECSTLVALRRVASLYKDRLKQLKVPLDKKGELLTKEIERFMQLIKATKWEFQAHRDYVGLLYYCTYLLNEFQEAQLQKAFPDRPVDQIKAECRSLEENVQSCERQIESSFSGYCYLRNRRKSLTDQTDAATVGRSSNSSTALTCPVCLSEPTRYYVLICGHLCCESCLTRLRRQHHTLATTADLGQAPEELIHCPECRQQSPLGSLSNTLVDSVAAAAQLLKANDSWSTKMVEVVHTVKSILQTTSADDCRPEKVLLFSTWPKLLSTVRLALAESDIKSVMVQQASSSGNFARNIKTFKHSDDVNVLLLPTTFAANGLNLTEANHVIFINSSLNRAEEQQAVGRVYRMGQQKQTHVYKFIIKSSIEEAIEDTLSHSFTRQNGGALVAPVANSEHDSLTVDQLLRLFSN